MIERRFMRRALRHRVEIPVRLESMSSSFTEVADDTARRNRVVPDTGLQIETQLSELVRRDPHAVGRMNFHDSSQITSSNTLRRIVRTPLQDRPGAYFTIRASEDLCS